MIKLDVKAKCHDCPYFTPESDKEMNSNFVIDTVVRCKFHSGCYRDIHVSHGGNRQ